MLTVADVREHKNEIEIIAYKVASGGKIKFPYSYITLCYDNYIIAVYPAFYGTIIGMGFPVYVTP